MVGGVDARLAAAQQRVHARQQLGEGEGLDQIIVGAAFQPFDPVADRGQRGQDQDRRLDLRGAQRLEHGQPVEDRKHAIEDDEVEAAVGGAEQTVLAVGRLLDAMAFLGQALREVGGGFAVVLDQQDLASHGGFLTPKHAWRQ